MSQGQSAFHTARCGPRGLGSPGLGEQPAARVLGVQSYRVPVVGSLLTPGRGCPKGEDRAECGPVNRIRRRQDGRGLKSEGM